MAAFPMASYPRRGWQQADVAAWTPGEPPGDYFNPLAPHTAEIEIWEAECLGVLQCERPVLERVKVTVLPPMFAALDRVKADAFVGEYAAHLDAAYPSQAGGRTLPPFRWIVLLAGRRRLLRLSARDL